MVLWRPHANESAQSLQVVQILLNISGSYTILIVSVASKRSKIDFRRCWGTYRYDIVISIPPMTRSISESCLSNSE